MKKITKFVLVAILLLAGAGVMWGQRVIRNNATTEVYNGVTYKKSVLEDFTQAELEAITYYIQVGESTFIDGKTFEVVQVDKKDLVMLEKAKQYLATYDLSKYSDKTLESVFYRTKGKAIEIKDGLEVKISKSNNIQTVTFDTILSSETLGVEPSFGANIDLFGDIYFYRVFTGTNYQNAVTCHNDGGLYNTLIGYDLVKKERRIIYKGSLCEDVGIEGFWIPKSTLSENPKLMKLVSGSSIQTREAIEVLAGGCVHPKQVGLIAH